MFKRATFLLLLLLCFTPVLAVDNLVPNGPAILDHFDVNGDIITAYDNWCWDDTGAPYYALYVTYPVWTDYHCSVQYARGDMLCADGTCCRDIPLLEDALTMVVMLERDLCASTEAPMDPGRIMEFQCPFTHPIGWCQQEE